MPVGVPPSTTARGRDRRSVQRRTAAAAMLGLGEAADDDESIIPDDAEEVQNIAGPSGIKADDAKLKKDREAPEPDYPSEVSSAYGDDEDRLLSPRDALVAPDVTPQAMEPIDASEVPAAKGQYQQGEVPRFIPAQPSTAGQINPMDVLLGRSQPPAQARREELPQEHVVTAESAQSMVNTVLSVNGLGGNAILQQGQPMPDPKPGNANKIMETFSKYGPVKTWNF